MDIGAKLKEARVSKELSLDELQEITKIQKRYLTAIEEGKLEILPGKFYARAFIKEYANAVGIDPSDLLEEHKEEIPKTEDDSVVQYSRMERTRKESNVEKNTKIFSVFPTVIVVLLVIGILFVFWYFWNGMSGANNDTSGEDELQDNEIIINNPDGGDNNEGSVADDTEDNEQNEEEPSNKEESPGEENLGNGANTEDEVEEPSRVEIEVVEEGTGKSPESTLELRGVSEEVSVVLETTGNTWLDVKTGDETLVSENFVSDNSPLELEITDTDQIFFNVGNAPDLTITINGVELEYPVNPNDYVHQRLRINMIKETE
ncbi:helix-turn-helix domain-containing protein [Oceanobacillus senegalensis]|uniref:helix-turn-helix domain-containing protein n=1 Tax=Oceanobacillus senegalensis TaxID=1936063 RepID=UPI000A30F673|nr:RodZ domain-containing protein [Oceanobacillus senegalensis]